LFREYLHEERDPELTIAAGFAETGPPTVESAGVAEGVEGFELAKALGILKAVLMSRLEKIEEHQKVLIKSVPFQLRDFVTSQRVAMRMVLWTLPRRQRAPETFFFH
jgi:hypothetical protein